MMLQLLMAAALLGGPSPAPAPNGVRVVKISPAEGGGVLFKNSEWTFVLGNYWGTNADGSFFERTWIWTPETGAVWLDAMVSFAENDARVREVRDLGSEYQIEIRTMAVREDGRWLYRDDTYFVWLPKDPAKWFGSGDFDRDGDVDQTDFGLLQRCLSGAGVPTSAVCRYADLDADGDADNVDMNIFTQKATGAR